MSVLKRGLKEGMWFQRVGERFFVPAKNIKAEFDSFLGTVCIWFTSDNPNTAASYAITTYGIRWALKEEDLHDIYKDKENND